MNMSFSKQASEQNMIANFYNDLTFQRKHPFLTEWKEWKQVCFLYHSSAITQLCQGVNRGNRKYNVFTLIPETQWLIDDVYWQHVDVISKIFDEENLETIWTSNMLSDISTPLHLECDCHSTGVNLWNNNCKYREIHLKAKISSFIWAYLKTHPQRRSVRKYYTKLERVMFSLPYDKLKQFDMKLITEPSKYILSKRYLLRTLYECGAFDFGKKDIQEMPFMCEYLKHFRQQSGTCQSVSAVFPDELFQIAEDYFSRNTFEESVNKFRVKQQGWFDINHKVSIDDSNFEKMKQIVLSSQKSFIDGMKDALIDTGRAMLVMFTAASTIALITKIAVGYSVNTIFKLLHWIYSLVCGDSMSKHINDSQRVIQQSGDDVSVSFLPAMILKYVVNAPPQVLESIWNNKQTDVIMRRIGYLGDPKIERGIEKLTEWVHKIAINVINYFCRYIGISQIEDLSLESSELNDWADSVDKIVKLYYADNFEWNDTNFTALSQMYSKGLALSRMSIYIRQRTMIWKMVTSLGNLLEKFKLHGRGASIRNPPVTIYLTGGTGVGKSSITYPIAVEILQMIAQKERFAVDLESNWKQLIYMRSAEQEFWDGYENQLVTVFDDFNQQVDSASNPSTELFEIIRASNCFPYPLHMADINQKANTTFNSKIIIVSTNMERPKAASLNFPDALNRRFDICVRINRKKINGLIQSDKFDPSLYELELYDIMTNQPISTIGYKELVYMCANEYFRRRSFVDSVESYITGLFKKEADQQMGKWGSVDAYGKFNPMSLSEKLQFKAEKLVSGTMSSIMHPWMALDAFKNQVNEWKVGASRWNDDEHKRYLFHQLNKVSDWFKSKKETVQNIWQKFRKEHSYLANAAIMLTVLGTSLAFLKVFYSFSRSFSKQSDIVTPEAFAESYTPTNIKGVKAEAYTPSAIKGVKAEAYTPSNIKGVKAEASSQGVKDINAAEILMSVARKNLYKITESTRDVVIGHVLFLKGKVAIMPKHYLYAFNQSLNNDSNATVSFEAVLLKRSFTVAIKDLLKTRVDHESPDESLGPVWSRDLMSVVVDTSIIHADATSYFCTKSSLARVECTDVCLPILVNNNLSNSDRAVLMVRMASGRSALQRKESLRVGDDEVPVLRIIRDAWVYNLDTRTTECGAPLIVRNSAIAPGKICGIHVAGLEGTGKGFATPVYLEDVQKILSCYHDKDQFEQKIRLQMDEYPQQQCQLPADAEFIRLGSVKTAVAQPSKSKIEPSLCYKNIREPVSKPCLLRKSTVDGKPFDPRGYRLGRLGNYPEQIDEDLIKNSKEALIDEMCSVLSQTKDSLSDNIKNRYTFEEAVIGIDGEPYVTSIKRNTSPGYPFVHMKGFEQRTAFFGNDAEYKMDSPQCEHLKLRVNQIVENAKNGIVLDHIFMDTLKDERKPIHKAHKTRLFAAGPIDYLIACKMYFNPIVAVLQKMRNWCHVSVGTNPYSQDWSEIARCLLRKSEEMIAGDFEGFDASQHQRLLEAAGEVLIQLSIRFCGSTPEDVKVMRVLLVSLFNSIHITGNEIYQWTHSLPSGHYLTAIINSIFVNMGFLCVWQLAFERSYTCARSFYEKCAIVAYGDDHIVSVSPSCLDKFNQMTLTALFKKIGLGYTMEEKDAVATAPSRKLEQIGYLKRSFRKDELTGQWLAPLSLDTVLETPMWLHKCPDKALQTIDNLEWALKELALHESTIWDEWSPVLKREGEKLGHYTALRYQHDAKMACLSQILEM